jgi:hydrogenase-4 component F
MIASLVLLPLLAGLGAFFVRSRRLREVVLLGTASGHAALVAVLAGRRAPHPPPGWLGLDALGLLFLAVTSALFLATAVYGVGYLRREPARPRADLEEGFLFRNEPEPTFVACLLLFLASMTLVTLSRHLGLLWIAIEATTLASAPLIYFHRQHRSLEAAWKYLLVCSVGIGLALLGNLVLVGAGSGPGGQVSSLALDELLAAAPRLRTGWLETGFLLLLVGYGTKMGLAPMHTWLPDAHSESPSLVSALLSGALLNCAFLGILRSHQVLAAAGQASFARGPLLAFGLVSMTLAVLFLVRQPDYKRALAYSSVEHVGVMALGVGVGGRAAFGALLHVLTHSVTKAGLFLVAGNLIAAFASKRAAAVRGALLVAPRSGALWVAGALAIAGSPPFGVFVSEFTILRGALEQHQIGLAAAYVALLGIAFAAVTALALPMALGPAPEPPGRTREPWLAVGPPLLLCAGALLLGVHVPSGLARLLDEAARLVTAR